MANMPTEDVFTALLKTGVNGTVASTKPLSYVGNLIDNFTLTFKDGRIVDFAAETGCEPLKKLIETDEGSHNLGEVALVPHESPISNTNLIFFNTLFDENASNHLYRQSVPFVYPRRQNDEPAGAYRARLERQLDACRLHDRCHPGGRHGRADLPRRELGVLSFTCFETIQRTLMIRKPDISRFFSLFIITPFEKTSRIAAVIFIGYH